MPLHPGDELGFLVIKLITVGNAHPTTKMKNIATFRQTATNFPPLPPDYESWLAVDKQNFLWEKGILPSQYDRLPPLTKIDVLGLFFTMLRTKMDRLVDQAPRKWKKAIHAHGSVAKIKFVATPDSPFTGLFRGADYGLLRLSITGEPSDRGFAPGLAIKLFRDSKPSANFSALVSLIGQGDNYNFFAHEFSNIVPVVNKIAPRFINSIFRRVSKFPTKLYLQDLAQIDRQGYFEGKPYYPYQIFLVPNPQIHFSTSPHDFRDDLATIPAQTKLFSIYAVIPEQVGDKAARKAVGNIDTPEYRRQAQLIGQIETTSEFVSSFYGDSLLFFRHQRFANK